MGLPSLAPETKMRLPQTRREAAVRPGVDEQQRTGNREHRCRERIDRSASHYIFPTSVHCSWGRRASDPARRALRVHVRPLSCGCRRTSVAPIGYFRQCMNGWLSAYIKVSTAMSRLPHDDDLYVADFLASFTLQKQQAGYRLHSTNAFFDTGKTSESSRNAEQSTRDMPDVKPSSCAQEQQVATHFLGEEVRRNPFRFNYLGAGLKACHECCEECIG